MDARTADKLRRNLADIGCDLLEIGMGVIIRDQSGETVAALTPGRLGWLPRDGNNPHHRLYNLATMKLPPVNRRK